MKVLLRILGLLLTIIPLIVVGTRFQFKIIFIFLLEILFIVGWELIVVMDFFEDEIDFINDLIPFSMPVAYFHCADGYSSSFSFYL